MDKLTHVEASRMVAVLDEALHSLDLLSFISPDLPQDEVLGELGTEAYNVFSNQWAIEDRYMAVVNATSQGLTAYRPAEWAETEGQLKESTRQLCRVLRDSQSVLHTIQTFSGGAREDAMLGVIESLHALRESMLGKLGTTVEEADARQRLVEETQSKTSEAEQSLQAIEQYLRKERAEKEADTTFHNSIIVKLKAELQDINQSTEQKTAYLENDTRRQEAHNEQEHTATMAVLTEQHGKMADAHAQDCGSHASNEEALRKRKAKHVTELAGWISRYDADMGRLDSQLRSLQAQFDEEQRLLHELEEHFAKVDADRANIAEEERVINERRAKLREEQDRLDNAAARIQAMFRGWRDRRAVHAMKNKKKKKGKKGKKGKKKK